jgi:GntR family transcriptional regulator
MVQHGTSVPPWQQLAALLREQIESGELAPGAQLPSIVRLSQEHGIAVVTVQKALRALKAEGLIETTPGYGTFVTNR